MVFSAKDINGNVWQMPANAWRNYVTGNFCEYPSSYPWIFSAIELATLVKDGDFLAYGYGEYASEIYSCILRWFTRNERTITKSGGGWIVSEEDRQALQICYDYSDHCGDKKLHKYAKDYLYAMIEAATRPEDTFDLIRHPGDAFKNFCKIWIKEKFAKYADEDNVEIAQIVALLTEEWRALKKQAEERGDFKDDDMTANTAFVHYIQNRCS